MQAVPSATLDTTKLSEDSSWFQKASKAVASRILGNEEEQTKNSNRSISMPQYEDSDEYETITTEMLSEALESMNRLNDSTISVESYDYTTLDVQSCSKFEEDLEWLNSTVDKINDAQQKPKVDGPDERPIRNRKQVQQFQIKW